MATTTLKTRIQHKYNTPSKWAEDASFVPLKGEICIFNNGAGVKPEMKIGDGTTTLASLPFLKAGSDIQINSGSANGTISVSVDGSTKDVAVKGLGARAFDSTSYLPLSGGTLTGVLSLGNTNWILQDFYTGESSITSRQNGKAHAIQLGVPGRDYLNFYEYGGVFNFYKTSDIYTVPNSVSDGVLIAQIAPDGFIGNLIGNASTASSVAWSGITGKPSTFTPSSHSHDYIASLGATAPQTGRTNAYNGAYTYKTTAGDSSVGAPNTHTAVIGFGYGAQGSAEIAVQWTSEMGVWVRALRDYQDNWYDWCEILTQKSWNNYITLSSIGAAPASHTHSYLPLSGGTLTGPLTISGGQDLYLKAATGTDAGDIVFVKPDGSEYIRLWSQTGTNLLIRFGSSDSAKNIIHSGNYTDYTVTKTGSGASGTWGISITGNAARANALEGSGNLIFTGDHLLQSVSRPNCQLHFGTDRLYTHDANGYQIIWRQGDSITGAVWNDYAEYRESDCAEFGRILAENGDDTLSATTERLQHFAGISSDTWGFCQGETERAKTPIAVAGRVLAYPYRDRDEYKPGDCLCAAPNGTVDIMTREEVEHYPDRIVGTVSCVPEYEEWGQGDRPAVKVDGRIWMKVR